MKPYFFATTVILLNLAFSGSSIGATAITVREIQANIYGGTTGGTEASPDIWVSGDGSSITNGGNFSGLNSTDPNGTIIFTHYSFEDTNGDKVTIPTLGGTIVGGSIHNGNTTQGFNPFPIGSATGRNIIYGSGVDGDASSTANGSGGMHQSPFELTETSTSNSFDLTPILTDGPNGMNISTAGNNINQVFEFAVDSLDINFVNDGVADIVMAQMAAQGTNTDEWKFVDSMGNTVGNVITYDPTADLIKVGEWRTDRWRYDDANGNNNGIGEVDEGAVAGTPNSKKNINMFALELSEFGINAGNIGDISKLVVDFGGATDPSFIGYNKDAIIIPPLVPEPSSFLLMCLGALSLAFRRSIKR